jgi:hypothetical protein
MLGLSEVVGSSLGNQARSTLRPCSGQRGGGD